MVRGCWTLAMVLFLRVATAEGAVSCGYNTYVNVRVESTTGGYTWGVSRTGAGSQDCTNTGSYCGGTYQWPTIPEVWWLIKIGNNGYRLYAPPSGTLQAPAPDRFTQRGPGNGLDTLICEWYNFGGESCYVRIDYRVTNLSQTRGAAEVLLERMIVAPFSTGCKSIGGIWYLDLNLCGADGAAVGDEVMTTNVPGRESTPNVSSAWRMFPTNYPGAQAENRGWGILRGFEIPTPADSFWYGTWPGSNTLGYNDSFPIAAAYGGDSAERQKWAMRTVCPGETLVMANYLGIGNVDSTRSLTEHSVPPEVTHCGSIRPDTVSLSLIVMNEKSANYASAIRTQVRPVDARLTILSGANPQSVAHLNGGGVAHVSTWRATIDPTATDSVCYDLDMLLTRTGPPINVCSGAEIFGATFETDSALSHNAGGDWAWGAPTSGPGAAHYGAKCWGTVLGGNYNSNRDDVLVTAPLVLTGSAQYCFSFWHWYAFAAAPDGGYLQVTTNGGALWTRIVLPTYNGTVVGGFTGWTGSSGGWRQEFVDLTPYAGMTAQLRFHFVSDAATVAAGWYVDDLSLKTALTSTTDSTFTMRSCIQIPPLTAPPTPTIVGGDSVCGSGTRVLSVTGGPYTKYRWSTGESTATISVTLSATTAYSVTVWSGFCLGSAQTTVPVVTVSPPTPGPDGGLCSGGGDTVQLWVAAQSGFTHLWSGPGIVGPTTGDTIRATVIGTYLARTYRAPACTSAAVALNITQGFVPPPTAGRDTVDCVGDTVLVWVTPQPGYAHHWTGPSIAGSSVGDTIRVTGVGAYLARSFPAPTCSSTTVQVSVYPASGCLPIQALGFGASGAPVWSDTTGNPPVAQVIPTGQVITLYNRSAQPIDFGLYLSSVTTLLVDTVGGADRFNVQALLNQSFQPPATTDYIYAQDVVPYGPPYVFGDAVRWGGGAYDVTAGAPGNERRMWLMLVPPTYFSQTAFTMRLRLTARVHVP